MNLTVTSEAANWYKSEMNINHGDKVRFFVRYGGCSTVQSGFSLGVELAEPFDIGVETIVDGIVFFIEAKDMWYFDDHHLLVTFNSDLNEPVFEYPKK